MARRPALVVLVLLAAALVSTLPLPAAGEAAGDVKKAIGELHQTFSTALANGDAAAIARQCTEKARLMSPNQEAIDGRDRIQAFWQALIDVGVKSATLEITEVEVSGDTAYETGKYKVFGVGEQQLEQGKYLVVWKKVGGTWKTHRDCWNSNEKRDN